MPAATSAERLERCLPIIFHGEGGYTANRKDPGNWTGGKVGKGILKGTKYGIAAASFPNVDIKNLTQAQAAEIYRQQYWTSAGCDKLPDGVDLPIFDVSVNSGPGRARSFRDATAKVIEAVARIKAISAKRRAFYQGLSTFKTFGKGWMSRVATVEAAAIKMALAAAGTSPVLIQRQLLAEVDVSKGKVKTGSSAAAGTGTVGALTATQGADWLQIGIAVGVIALALAVAIHFIRAHQERANAFLQVAQEV